MEGRGQDESDFGEGGKIKMQREMDTIQIESRHEIREILKFLEKHYAEVQENSTLKRLYDLLDVMGMDW